MDYWSEIIIGVVSGSVCGIVFRLAQIFSEHPYGNNARKYILEFLMIFTILLVLLIFIAILSYFLP